MALRLHRPQYQPFPKEVLSQGNDEWQTYSGNCHCGRVKFQLRLSPPFPDHEVCSCNCSICCRNGYILVYPLRNNVKFLGGENAVGKYKFNRRKASHVFCQVCGSSIYIDFNNQELMDVLGINVRILSAPDFSQPLSLMPN
jgi:hypothetical protein